MPHTSPLLDHAGEEIDHLSTPLVNYLQVEISQPLASGDKGSSFMAEGHMRRRLQARPSRVIPHHKARQLRLDFAACNIVAR